MQAWAGHKEPANGSSLPIDRALAPTNPIHKPPNRAASYPKEKTMTDLFPGLADVLIVAGMCGTAVLLYAAAVLVRSLK